MSLFDGNFLIFRIASTILQRSATGGIYCSHILEQILFSFGVIGCTVMPAHDFSCGCGLLSVVRGPVCGAVENNSLSNERAQHTSTLVYVLMYIL